VAEDVAYLAIDAMAPVLAMPEIYVFPSKDSR